jgi:hypothetical protein
VFSGTTFAELSVSNGQHCIKIMELGVTTMKRIKGFITLGMFSLLLLGIPAVASAQWGGGYDPYGRNGGYDPYGRNGGYDPYGRNVGYGNTRNLVRSLKDRSKELQRQIDRELDRGRWDDSRREDRINDIARDFRNAVNRLDNNGRSNDGEIRRVMDLAGQMDRALARGRFSYNVTGLWQSIRNDLQQLGYGYYDNRNNRGRYPGNQYPGNQYPSRRNGLPSWWPF